MFPNEVILAAQAAQEAYTTHDEEGAVLTTVFASVTLAQWAVESAYGKQIPPESNNFFGIKAIPGQAFVACPTKEWANGKYSTVMQNFAKYPSAEACFMAHARLLARSGYYSAAVHDKNPKQFVVDMAKHYATAPTYASIITKVMDEYNLYQYDEVKK